MVSAANALFVVANVHQVSYENEVQVQQTKERHYKNVVRHRLSINAKKNKNHSIIFRYLFRCRLIWHVLI